MIDNVAKHPTPEGLMLTLVPAGLLPRCSAWLIDFSIRMVIIMIVFWIAIWFREAGMGLFAIAYFLIYWGYSVFFEVYRGGMTPGKKSRGIYVCHDDGTPISLQASLIRNLLRVADFLPIGFMAGIVAILFNRQSKRLGDMVAGTVVVYREQQELAKLYHSIYGITTDNSATSLASHATTNHTTISNNNQNQSGFPNSSNSPSFDSASALFFYPLQLNEQQAMLSFMERLPFLSLPRQQEIASVLSPLIKVTDNRVGQKQSHEEVCRLAVIERASIIQGKSSSAVQKTAQRNSNDSVKQS
ncbi:RDD family protein [Psychrobacter sp. I-STPA6b]|uniref:RDD family protein n=1 Tax=Psychrobacter sp. I-STPA6b TaxID=2585718 RepID=UPI001D0C7636|nr:RDD family protein [Psychrobacter sp. I-STPA6b]